MRRNAGRYWNFLLEQKMPRLQAAHALAQRGERFEHQIVGWRPTHRRKRPGNFQGGAAARLQGERVGQIGERH
jgi:hypothetical protein